MGVDPAQLTIPRTIETARLVLRPVEPGDVAGLNAAILESWESLHRWMPWARERPTLEHSAEMARKMEADFAARRDLSLLILLRDNGTILGGTGLHRIDWSVPRFEIGYWLGTAHENRGFATEAVRAVSRLAFDACRAERVEIHCSHRNVRSRRVAEGAGFTLEARLRHHSREPSGELRDTLVFALLRGEALSVASRRAGT